MEDHDGSNSDEWEEGSLAIPPFYTEKDFADLDPIDTVISPPRQKPNAPVANGFVQQALPIPRSPLKNGYGTRYGRSGNEPISDRAPNLYRPQIGGIAGRRGGILSRQVQDDGMRVGNVAEASYVRKEPHGGEYTFSRTWKGLLADLHGEKTRTWARLELSRMSRQSGTFILTPSDHSDVAEIWGTPHQVAEARTQLEIFEKAIRVEHTERKKDVGKWEKISALDGREKHRSERKAQADSFMEQQRQLGEMGEFDYEYWLLWPSQHLDFDQLNPTSIEELKKNFLCTIDYNAETSFVRIMANQERKLLQVVQRIVNLVKEMVARLNQVIKANLFQQPSSSAYRASVRLDKSKSTLAIPTLQGAALPEAEGQQWEDFILEARRSNRKQVGNALESCFKYLRLSGKHVRMRLNLGQLGFKRYQLSSEGGSDYKFDDFCAMVSNDRTALELQGIPIGPETDNIVDRCANHPSFFDPVEVYVVHFDFKDPGEGAILRFECEFRPKQGHKELEIGSQRWLEFQPGAESTLLEVNMLDFETLDWQMTLDAAIFPDNRKLSRELTHFQNSVTFRARPEEGLKAEPKRRAFYAAGNRGLTCVTEMTTVRYRVKDTEGTLELTRKEEYSRAGPAISARPSVSTMSASYYYPEWDNLLAEYASLEPGGQVSWQASLSTFFPTGGTESRASGLKKFIEEVNKIKQALSGESRTTQNNQASGALPELPNGVASTDHGVGIK